MFIVVLNPDSAAGRNVEEDRLRALFHDAGAEIAIVSPDSLTRATVTAHSVRAVVAAGGDGTVSSVAASIAGGTIPLGVLPLGTLNHFAKDLKIPLDLEDAVETVVAGRLQHVDVAYVNDHLFLNNSSIGIYPGIVELREELRRRGHNKWASFAVAIAKTVRRDAELFLQVKIEEHMIETRTPFLFIGNNEYAIEGIRLGSRAALDRGQLFAYLAPRTRTRELPKLLLLALAGQARKHGAFATLESADMWVQTRDNAPLQVSADGEVVILAPPLHYRIAPRALRVITPTQ